MWRCLKPVVESRELSGRHPLWRTMGHPATHPQPKAPPPAPAKLHVHGGTRGQCCLCPPATRATRYWARSDDRGAPCEGLGCTILLGSLGWEAGPSQLVITVAIKGFLLGRAVPLHQTTVSTGRLPSWQGRSRQAGWSDCSRCPGRKGPS